MPLDKWVVLIGGVTAIAWLNWHFFAAARRTASARVTDSDVQEAVVVVRGGYDPAEIRVKAGLPARLIFDRQDTSSCSEEVVLGAFGIRKTLPAHERTSVEIAAPAKGRYDITCGMNVIHGALVVE